MGKIKNVVIDKLNDSNVGRIDQVAAQYAELSGACNAGYCIEAESAFKAGAQWQSGESVIMASEAIQKAILRHNAEEQKRVLENYRQICGCYHKGSCAVDGEVCTFMRCETLKDLFKE